LSGRNDRSFGSGVVTGLVAGLLIAAAIGVVAGLLTDDGDDDAVSQARDVIERNYFEQVGSEQLEESSIRGMVDGLRKRYDDRFSHYFSPDQLDDFEAATSGEFSGVGLTVNEVKRGLRVAAVLPDTPAERAGIEEGDLIVAVDGHSIKGVPSDVSTARIKGPPGTDVELRVVSADSGKSSTLTIERASVRVPAVNGRIVRVDGRPVAYVALHTFSDGAHGELREEIERLYRRGAEGLVIDLRGNGGGLLNEAVLTSSIFVEDGPIVSTKSRTQGEREYDATGGALDPRPTVVLVNRDTASAAEILTAALEVHGLATVAGETTFGKGTFQEVLKLPAGGALDLTIGQYLTADGTSLAGEGIHPEVRALDDPRTDDRDEGLDGALDALAPEIAASDDQ
jgi:carboxyl-terminal processing protease